jgi:hypothetical protein
MLRVVGRLISFGAALAVAGLVAASVFAAGPSATCSAVEQAKRSAAAVAYAKAIPAARKKYFAAHKSASLRALFVKLQKAQLAALRSEADCTVSETTTPGTTTPTTGLQLDFDTGIDAVTQGAVGDDLRRAVSDEQTLTGVAVTNATAFISDDASWLGKKECDVLGFPYPDCYASVAAQFATGSTVATGGCGGTWIYLPAPDFQYDSPAIIQKILAHEVFHVLQCQLDGLHDSTTPENQVRPSGPWWLTEGSAELVGYRVTGDWGLQGYATSFAQEVAGARQIGSPLDQQETLAAQRATPNVYYLYEVAVDHLVAQAPGGLSSLTTYFKALGAGKNWPDAFQQAFGRTIDAYYADFAAYRATL